MILIKVRKFEKGYLNSNPMPLVCIYNQANNILFGVKFNGSKHLKEYYLNNTNSLLNF